MIFNLFLFRTSSFQSLLESKISLSSAKLACTGNNTELDEDFKICVCKKGYIGNAENGGHCYKCENKCHRDARCTGMNQCTCNEGLYGDGVQVCDFPRPILQSVHPTKCDDLTSFITFSFIPSANFNTTKPYCRIGPSISVPSEYNGTHAVCSCPTLFKGKYKFEISYDKKYWSKQDFTINYPSDGSNSPFVFFSIAIFIIISILIYFVIWCIKNIAWNNGDDADQILPLNKWHMSQIQHDSADDGNILKFILNLIVN